MKTCRLLVLLSLPFASGLAAAPAEDPLGEKTGGDTTVFATGRNAFSFPARRKPRDAQVPQGQRLFQEAQCATCHRPGYVTATGSHPRFSSRALEGQRIHPYTDLLLHDMGEGLADGRPDGQANGRQWKTPPLWGLGLIRDVNGHTRLLHDGRAEGVLEAILWHAGEAEASRDRVLKMDRTERDALVNSWSPCDARHPPPLRLDRLAVAGRRRTGPGRDCRGRFSSRLVPAMAAPPCRRTGVLAAREGLTIAAALEVPTRAHGLLLEPGGTLLTVARRPGDRLLRWSTEGRPLAWRWIEPRRAFCGHVMANADGRTLYTTEMDLDTGAGPLGVRDAASLEKRAEWPTHGIDPHQLVWDAVHPGRLIVANGGVPTRPETGRLKLDLERMDSSLVALDAGSGSLCGQWRLDDARLSLRHLAWGRVEGRPLLGIALQAEHDDAAQRTDASVLALFDGARLRAPRPERLCRATAATLPSTTAVSRSVVHVPRASPCSRRRERGGISSPSASPAPWPAPRRASGPVDVWRRLLGVRAARRTICRSPISGSTTTGSCSERSWG